MAFEYYWLEPHRVAYCVAHGILSVEEQLEMNRIFVKMAAETENIVHFILNGHDATIKIRLRDAMQLRYVNPPNSGWTILIGTRWINTAILGIITDLMRVNFTYTSSLQEAIDFLTERDITLDKQSMYASASLTNIQPVYSSPPSKPNTARSN